MEQVRVNQASQLRLMWWKFKRHKVALVSGIFLAMALWDDPDLRVSRALRPAYTQCRFHLCAAAERSLFPRG